MKHEWINVMGEILLVIWGICMIGYLVGLICNGFHAFVSCNINSSLNGRITRLYRVGMHESGYILKSQYIHSWRDLFKRYF